MNEYPITAITSPDMIRVSKIIPRLILEHIKRGLEKGTWTIIGNRPIPVAMLPFYEKGDIMTMEEETCAQIAP